jgi:hypothetical protein
MTHTNNKKHTRGVVASARNNATKGYAQLMKDYFQTLLSKTREEVIEIRLNLDKRFNNYILACKEAEKLLFNKELSESKEQLSEEI